MTDGRDQERDDRHLQAVDEREDDVDSGSSGEGASSDSSGTSDAGSSESERPVEPVEEAPGDAAATDDTDDTDEDTDPVARERDELRDTLQRVQAEFENFRKRTMRDQTAQLERATERLVEQLLPVLDSFELAALNVPEGDLDDAAEKLRKGVELVYAELLGVLEKAGLERIEAHGRAFDPEEHEAVMREGEGDVVTEVMRTGYRLKGRVLRPAMVKVGGPEEEE